MADAHTPGVIAHDVGPAPTTRRLGPAWWLAFAALWLGLLAYGLRARFEYETTPGMAGHAPSQFPAQSKLSRASDRSTLFMFVHPECPCTRASLQELASLLAQPDAKVMSVLVIAPPVRPDRRWDDMPGASIARTIPSLLRRDDDGTEAARFGALTSGYVVLYDAHGTLQFAGGITGSRGQAGENVGRATAQRLIRQQGPTAERHAVYGCPFEDSR